MGVSGDGGELVGVGEFGQSVDRGVHAVRAVHADDPGDHLLLEGYVRSDVVDQALLVQLGDQIGPQPLADLGGDFEDAGHESAVGEALAT